MHHMDQVMELADVSSPFEQHVHASRKCFDPALQQGRAWNKGFLKDGSKT